MNMRIWLLAIVMALACPVAALANTLFSIRMDLAQPASGRLLVVAQPVNGANMASFGGQTLMAAIRGVSADPSPQSHTAVAAMPQVTLAKGDSVTLDGDALAFPHFSSLPPGRYLVQAVLDVDQNYAYFQHPTPGDLVSAPVVLDLPAASSQLVLSTVRPPDVSEWDRPLPTVRPGGFAPSDDDADWLAEAKQRFLTTQTLKTATERVLFPSPLLSAFYGAPTPLRAYVLTPPGYQTSSQRYPVVFRAEGFGADFDTTFSTVQETYDAMLAGRMPPMIWVFLDHASPTGTHEFADSVNNGPWGAALTSEFIPWLDGKYRTDGAASGRFLTGHSSGGWAALWLQVRYPKLFGGAWPTAPDPSDFHAFSNVDIYTPNANAYVGADGKPIALVRSRSPIPTTQRDYALFERVLGDHGGQFDSFDAVFSPHGADGRPLPLFDRATGAIDPAVAAYWRDHYDISYIIQRDARSLKPDLDGKIHLWVGTADTYYLDAPARLLQARLDAAGIGSDFHFVEGATHDTLVPTVGANGAVDFLGLTYRLAWEMYAKARPNSPLKAPP
ncbi:MAG: enterochelin esterase-like enzyme [Caulobacteraceae bacterium]|nr:enterochelin esterase-like enzyme [Caulobacteraceae bacterium]